MNTSPSVKSATRVLDLLEMLGSSSEALGVSEVARRMDIPKSSAHMLLLTLEQRHYVICDEARRFRLHPMFSGEARSWVGGFRAALLEIGRKVMADLVKKTGETSFLAVQRDGQNLEYIEKILSPLEVRCDAELFLPRAMHSNSPGLVMLAFQSETEREVFLRDAELKQFTPKTIIDVDVLRREFAAVRKNGYAATMDSNTAGVSGVSAPVFDARGEVVAALNVSAPTPRFKSSVENLTREVVHAAELLSRDLSRMTGLNVSKPEAAIASDRSSRKRSRTSRTK
jgi:DNA-binding IclR family transcriptional regulator